MNKEANPRTEEEAGSHGGDDAVIGRAFRWSILFIALAGLLATLIWLISSRPDTQSTVVQEPALTGPLSLPQPQAGASPPRVAFTDITREAGIDFVHVNGAYGERLLPETMGGGVAFLDFNNDGAQDLMFVNASEWPGRSGQHSPTAALYRNLGDGKFDNVTEELGLAFTHYGTGVAVGDYDGDGFVDLYLSALGPNRLLRNVAGEHFDEVLGAGVSGEAHQWSTSAAFLDYDGDGDLDLFVANYVEWSPAIDFEVDYRLTGIGRAYGPPSNFQGTGDYLFRNDGEGRFSDVSQLVRVENSATGRPVGKGLGVLTLDIDRDGRQEILVANDTVRNFLFRPTAGGKFEEIGMDLGIAFDNSGSATGAMGIDGASYNEDGDVAVAIGNFANEMTSFYVSQGGAGLFTDEAIVSGVGPESRRALSFGLFFFDYDLDGRVDLLQANGHVEPDINQVQPSQHYEQPAQLFWNCGLTCSRHFVPVGDAGDLQRPIAGRAAAYADIDGDGDLDVAITGVSAAPMLLRNDQQTGHHWLRVLLKGKGDNTGAFGARVELVAGELIQYREVTPARSYLSQVEQPLTFGLGENDRVDALRIVWPDGQSQVIEEPQLDRVLTIEQP